MSLTSLLLKLTPRPIQWLFARPYIAGKTREEALAVADRLFSRYGFLSTIDVLGEHVTSSAQVEDEFAEYLALVDAVGARAHANVSIKLSALGQGLPETEAHWERIRAFAERARALGQFFRIDMEDASTTDATLGTYRRLREAGYDNLGIVLQTRLNRTATDIQALAPLAPAVRLCIGIYREPAAIALTDKPAMKARLFEQALTLLDNGQQVAIATHDEPLIERLRAALVARGVPKDRLEFQMLLGVPRRRTQQALVSAGYRVRLYVPYGRQWYAYASRRLMANPAIVRHVMRNGLARLFRWRR